MTRCLRYRQTAWLPTQVGGLVIILLVAVCFRGSAASNRIDVASAPGAISRSAAGASFTPILSADGGHVAFISSAKDLVPNDNLAEYFDVFVRDLVLSNTVLVSVNLAGTAGGNDHSISPSVNSNAQMIAFASTASDLVSGDTNNTSDIFVRDLVSARTLLVSLNLAGTGPGNGPSRKPSISRDGRFVVFESAASDLVANDANNASDVFVRDLALGTTTLVSLDSSGAGSANGASELLHVTPDARFIAFRSLASNVTDQAKTPGGIFVRDRELGITYWATVNLSSTNLAQPRRFLTALSDSGRYIALEEDIDSLGAGANVYRHDLWTGLTDQAQAVGSSYFSAPAISANGDRIAFAGDQIYIWELANAAETRGIFSPGVELSEIRMSADGHTVLFLNRQYPGSGFQLWTWEDNSAPDGRTDLVSAIPAGNPTSGELRASFPNLSSDGNLIVFDGTPEDLVEGDWNKASDVFIRHMASGVTTLVSVRNSSLPPASTGTALTKLYRGSLSANGQQLVFTSQDNVLVPFDTNYWQDLFLRDLVAGTNRGVSGPLQLVPPLQGGTGPQTNSYIVQTNSALAPMISADGRFIAFDLSYAYPNSVTNSYRFDGSTGSVMRVALDINRQAREGYAASMSADGRWVLFQTREPVEVMNCCWQYLSQPDGNGSFDIVLRDFGDPFLAKPYPGYPDPAPLGIPVSTTAGNTVGNNASFQPIISPDGQWSVFQSSATDLTTNPISAGSVPHLFARNLATRKTKLLDRHTNGVPFAGGATNPVISLDSHYVFFEDAGRSIFRHDLLHDAEITVYPIYCRTNTQQCLWWTNIVLFPNLLVCTNCAHCSVSGDGALVAYETMQTTTTNLALRDLRNETMELISVNALGNGSGNGPSVSPWLSFDGHYVVFQSRATDLVANDLNGAPDIFVRDRWANRTLLISSNYLGTGSANGPSSRPVLSADGRTIAFQSFASDLVPGDYNNTRDVFVLKLTCPDSDQDGLEDCWELHHFGSLSRDGTGDFDGDSLSDQQEFLLGSSPVDAGSVLRFTSVTSRTNYYYSIGYWFLRETALSWSAAPGRAYRLQYKANLGDLFWTTVPGDIIAGGTSASKRDYNLPRFVAPERYLYDTNRFYRVIENPPPIEPPDD